MASKNLAVLDLETDPFKHGHVVQPFLAGFYDGARQISFWSDDCVAKLVGALEQESKEWVIYAHNGGRFDFFYFLPHLSGRGGPGNDMRIINGRIVCARLGKHELRDSFSIMPFALKDYDKDVIDYQKFAKDKRERHRAEIEKYFSRDLTALYELVVAFHAEFGDKLTIGSAAMAELKKRCKFSSGSKAYDEKWRRDFYYGGRNQVFKGGMTRGDIRVYDVNSMYPFVMQSALHPVGIAHSVSDRVEDDTVFVVAEGHNQGAFPQRQPDNSLDFSVPFGTFSVTIHEWRAALETRTFKPTRVIKTYGWTERATFDEFVSYFYHARAKAKSAGDKIRTIFYKFVLNSAYGKFAQNPDNYYDWFITPYSELPPARQGEPEWVPCYIFELSWIIWKRPLKQTTWYNIATAASITGAARAVLLRGICATREPLYCDTDSIICRGDSSVAVDAVRLGAWDLEARGQVAAIAGKKLYAIWDSKGVGIKKAHKGARLSFEEIRRITEGETIENENPVPAFKWDGTATFTKRRIRRTDKI